MEEKKWTRYTAYEIPALLLAQVQMELQWAFLQKILPHNFCELIDAAVKCLRWKRFELYPDFLTGGNDWCGKTTTRQAGRKRRRYGFHIEEMDKKTLAIRSGTFPVE